jgi:hypothetical protein
MARPYRTKIGFGLGIVAGAVAGTFGRRILGKIDEWLRQWQGRTVGPGELPGSPQAPTGEGERPPVRPGDARETYDDRARHRAT